MRDSDSKSNEPINGTNDDGKPTRSSEMQKKMEVACAACKSFILTDFNVPPGENFPFQLDWHCQFVRGLWRHSGSGKSDGHRSWMAYWSLSCAKMLSLPFPDFKHYAELHQKLSLPDGGYSGGPGGEGHAGPTYGMLMALIHFGEPGLKLIDRNGLYKFWMGLKKSDGAFETCPGGEVDMRATYFIISMASLLHMLTPELIDGVAERILESQSFDGGIGGEPDTESHSAYTFCAYGSIVLLDQAHRLNSFNLLSYLTKRQMASEGGFQGRPNKLVDSCYSFWVGATLDILHNEMRRQGYRVPENNRWYKHDDVESYLLNCCQKVEVKRKGEKVTGGFRDQPWHHPDPLHTNYSLMALALIQMIRGHEGPFPRLTTVYAMSEDIASEARHYFAARPFKSPSGQEGEEGHVADSA